MSHIVKGKMKVAISDPETLLNALKRVGTVKQDAPLYRVGVGFTNETYSYVVIDPAEEKNRVGYRLNSRTGEFEQFQEDFGSVGRWTRKATRLVGDYYIAFQYEKSLTNDEGYSVNIYEDEHGAVQLEAEEPMY